jgi:catechol-2,3-dioxygenase
MTNFITHVALYCRDLQKSIDWYDHVFGMKIIASSPGRFAALSFGEKHHDVALVQAPDDFGPPEVKKAGLYHVSIDTGSFDNSMRAYERAMEMGATAEKAIDHRLGHGIYIRDPDLNLIELWSESFPSYAEAIDSLPQLDPPFSENPVGWHLNIDEVYDEWKKAQDE